MENFCSLEKNKLGSECLAGNLRNRKTCGFYEKARQVDDCSFFRFDFMCDCLKAQMTECSISLNNGNGKGNVKKVDEREQEEQQRLLFYDQG